MSSRKIGALWMRKMSDGKPYLSGILEDLTGNINIAVFKNDRKEKENQPDYNIVLSEKKERVATKTDDFFGETPAVENREVSPFPDSKPEVEIKDIPF